MNIALWIVQALLALTYFFTGFMKVFMLAKAKEQLTWPNRHPDNFTRLIGLAEMLGALGLILPILTGILPWLTPLAAVCLVVVQILAIVTEHLPHKEYQALPGNIVLLLLALFVALGMFGLFPVS